MGFGGLGFRVLGFWGLGFRVLGFWCLVQGLGVSVRGFGVHAVEGRVYVSKASGSLKDQGTYCCRFKSCMTLRTLNYGNYGGIFPNYGYCRI